MEGVVVEVVEGELEGSLEEVVLELAPVLGHNSQRCKKAYMKRDKVQDMP